MPEPEKERWAGIDVDVCIDRGDFWLGELFVFLEIALIAGLQTTPHFSVAIFVEDVRVVVVIRAAADGEDRKEGAGSGQARQAVGCETYACGQGIVGAAASQQHRNDTEKRGNREPIEDRPKQ